MNTTTEFCIFELIYVPNFSLNWQVWFFGPYLPKKSVSGLKQNSATEFCLFELVYVPNFSLNWQFWFFGQSLPKRGNSSQKWKKWNHHWILHFQISLATKFQLKLTSLIFWTKFAQNGCFWWSKRERLNSAIEFCIFELGPIFQFKLTILIFWIKFAQKGNSSQKQKKWTTTVNSACSNQSRCEILA